MQSVYEQFVCVCVCVCVWQMMYREMTWLGSLQVEEDPSNFYTVLLVTTEASNEQLMQTKLVCLHQKIAIFTCMTLH